MNVRVPAVVMNLYYTGLGIARSLGEQGVPVIGLTAHRGVYGNFTRYAKTLRSPDSRSEPGRLLEFLCDLGRSLESGGLRQNPGSLKLKRTYAALVRTSLIPVC